MPADPNRKLFVELARRGVYQAVGIYVAVAWGSIEILITASDRFGWPAWLGDAALILFLTGLPFVVLLSWAFDLTGSGLQRMDVSSLTGKALIAATLTIVLGLSSSWFLLQDDAGSGAGPDSGDGRPVIAVMPIENQSNVENGDLLAFAFTDEVINRINAHPDIVALDLNTVTSPHMTGVATVALGNEPLMDYTVRGTMRSAPYGLELRIRMTSIDGRVIWEHDTVVEHGSAVAMRAEQKFVAGEVASGVGKSLTGADYCEPSGNPQAVELFYEAKQLFEARGGDNVAAAARLLEQAIEIDPDYARAMDLLGAVYQRFSAWVLPQPEAYDMNREQLIDFIRSRPFLPVMKEALARCPSLASSYYTAEVYVPAPQTFADAVDIIVEALSREPGNMDLRSQLFGVYLKMGHLDNAKKVAEEMTRRDPLNPRNPYNLSTVARLQGDSQKALELVRRAVSMGYSQESGKAHMICDMLYLDDKAGLDELLGPSWQPGDMFSVDPRRVLASRTDPEVYRDLRDELSDLVDAGDRVVVRGLVGYSCSMLFELCDEELTRRAAQKLAEIMGRGEMPPIFWHHRYRRDWGNHVLDIEVWVEHWVDFWERVGPPDGCNWDGDYLDCVWSQEL